MSSCLHVIGLGPSGLEQLTLGNYRRLCNAKKVFVRTLHHPCVQELMAEGVQLESFDEVYDSEDTFEEVYQKITERLRTELGKDSEVIYAVPGHPMVAEKTIQLLWKNLRPEYEVIVHPAMSFVDEIFRVLNFDPIEGMLIRNYDALKDAGLTGREWLIIPQVYNQLIASEVKLDLMSSYPDEADVFIVQGLGTYNERVDKHPLFEMDHGSFDHLTTIVLPPCSEVISWTKLLQIMEILRSPDGCAWDREQNHQTLKPCLIEESYEVLEAIEKEDMYNLCEELGDLLLQVVFHAQIASENKIFESQDVLQGIIQKLLRRHPHVFGEEVLETADDVIRSWDRIKQEEKADTKEERGFFSDPKGLPALMLASSTQRRAAKIGFDWSDLEGPCQKVQEELLELQNALKTGVGIREEFGDLLFAMVNVSRFLKLDAEEVLREAVHKFQARFLKMVELSREEGQKIEQLSLNEMDAYWEKAKLQEKGGKLM
ncbi:nucleoside triphosphate pyrophosphohydrolase/pyrophosphatase MazG [Desulfosporosinus acididurans]|uniref:Nucleoside triphosphate pyrophosphohydrolase/pyrophosphatase MazG n=1 Tax=Desulfosporosinus acididurans TaxID=476652 RepID=A0A0J1FUQ6_9FIRM|nr:nucleoside triphosphate pyrophosphohydrolase [Desulfosporosinus acididurans]KLU67190.1 nucleoside triphosphate pyrophosphohydrolase/pyrophosphatase MazG [Desulfosporosinus acididurans]